MSTAARIDELRSKFEENPRRYFAPLANEYRKAGELSQAIALCREHLPKQPGHMSGHIVFGQALYESGELLEAQEIFEAALILDPENLIALRHLGDIARARGDASLARRWYERVLDADPRNDDISALLASLSQRLTPRSATPLPVTAVDPYTGAPAYAEPPAESDEPVDPFSAPDAPAWHTPSFLTPLASPAVSSTPAPAEAEQADDSQLLDLDFIAARVEPGASDELAGLDPTSLSPAIGHHHEQVQPLMDLDDSSGERSIDAGELESGDDVAGDDMPLTLQASIEPSEHSPWEEAPDPLALALDAFAANDPFDAQGTPEALPAREAELAYEGVESDEPPSGEFARESAHAEAPEETTSAAALHAEGADQIAGFEEFEEGLVAIEWPDASLINARAATPAHHATPISATPISATPLDVDAVRDAFGAEAHVPDAEVVAAGDVADVADAAYAAEVADAADAADAGDADAIDGAGLPVAERIAIAYVHEDLARDVRDDAHEADALDHDELEDELVLEEGLIDEDPPLSVAEVPWLAVAEEEREATDGVLLTAGWDDEESDDDGALSSEDDVASTPPAFVTETMAELFVAQGFLDRAVGVYEELVRRRPYDDVLSSRLSELRETLASEEATATHASPVEMPTAAPLVSASLTPASLPLIAAAAPRTARQFFAALATMRVARRTPAFGAVTVASPTPADGLASLFGEVPMPRDDTAARSLAQAFGSGENVEPGPSMFTPSEPDHTEASGSSTPAASASAVAPTAAPVFSFDRFFPDPATAGAPGSQPGRVEGAPSGAPVLGSELGSESSSAPAPSAGADLAQFAHWLKGLSNP